MTKQLSLPFHQCTKSPMLNSALGFKSNAKLLTILPGGSNDSCTLQKVTDSLLQSELNLMEPELSHLFTSSLISKCMKAYPVKHIHHAKSKWFPESGGNQINFSGPSFLSHLSLLTSPLCLLLRLLSPPQQIQMSFD